MVFLLIYVDCVIKKEGKKRNQRVSKFKKKYVSENPLVNSGKTKGIILKKDYSRDNTFF